MAQLNDTMVQGDLRVTGNIFADTASVEGNVSANKFIGLIDDSSSRVTVTYSTSTTPPTFSKDKTYTELKGIISNNDRNNLYVSIRNLNAGTMAGINYLLPLSSYNQTPNNTSLLAFTGIHDNTLHYATISSTDTVTYSIRYLVTSDTAQTASDFEPTLSTSRGVEKEKNASGQYIIDGSIKGFYSNVECGGTNVYGIALGNQRGCLMYNSSYILEYSTSVPSYVPANPDTGTPASGMHYFRGTSLWAYNAETASSANYASNTGVSDNLVVPRLNTSSDTPNSLIETFRMKVAEYGPNAQNKPVSDQWAYVMSLQGGDSLYASQIGIGMTNDGLWYRKRNSSGWASWSKVMNTTCNNKSSDALKNLLNPLDEGTSDFTDGTELVSSIANNSGFATADHVYQPYRRKASAMRNYIVGYGTGQAYVGMEDFTTKGMTYGDFLNSGTSYYGWKIGTTQNNDKYANRNFRALVVICDWTGMGECDSSNFVGILDINTRMNSATVALSNWICNSRLYSIIPQKIENTAGKRGWAIFRKADTSNYTYTWYIGRNPGTGSTTMGAAINYAKISIMPIFESGWTRAMERVTSSMTFTGSYDAWQGQYVTPELMWDEYSMGNDNTPVYINSNKRFATCNNVYARKIYDVTSGNYLSIRTGIVGTDTNTIYIL